MLEGKYLNKKISNAYENWDLFTPIVQVSFGINKKIESEIPVESWIIKDQVIGRTKTNLGYSISNYCFDHTMAPEGKSVIVIRFDFPWELWKVLISMNTKMKKSKLKRM